MFWRAFLLRCFIVFCEVLFVDLAFRYVDYLFPDESGSMASLKILEARVEETKSVC